ncbi:MAG: hypothetical protein WBQ86_00175, partial [Candidatus Binatus sp.]
MSIELTLARHEIGSARMVAPTARGTNIPVGRIMMASAKRTLVRIAKDRIRDFPEGRIITATSRIM